jgi:transposase
VPALGAHLPKHVVSRIENDLRNPDAYIDANYIEQMAANYSTTIQTIYKHKKRIERGLPVPKPTGGARRIITWRMEKAISCLLAERPWFYQDEIAEFLHEVFEITVDQSTVSRCLKRMNVSRKKLTITAAQRNEELRTQWRDDLQLFTAEQIICVDESGSDERRGDRLMGYAEKGVRALVSQSLARKERVSVLPAYTINGYIASTTFKGTLSGPMFEDFIIDQLLPLCNPFPGPRSVIFYR